MPAERMLVWCIYCIQKDRREIKYAHYIFQRCRGTTPENNNIVILRKEIMDVL